MSKETRYNLIFLVVIIALFLPGGIYLFLKRMAPGARRADMPDPMPQTIMFMDPQPVPPGMRRVAPPRTMNWLGTFINTIAGKDSMHDLMDPDGLPLMSDDKSFQVAAIRNMPNETRVWVLSWDPQDKKFFTAAAWSLSLRERTLDGKASDVQQAPIPDPVRDEMGENGLLKPPKNVAWRVLTFPSASSGTWRITATTPDRKDQIVFVPSFTNPVPTEK